MDGVALASVISSALLGAGGIYVGMRTTHKTLTEARSTEIRERRAASYLEVLRLVEREADWREAIAANTGITRGDMEDGQVLKPVPEAPSLTDRSAAQAHVSAFASQPVRDLYEAWRATMTAIEDHYEVIEWNCHQNYMGPETEPDPADVRKLLDELQPAQRAARRALADGIATELGHR